MTIINIRGTHGSGKSTVVRRVLDLYENTSPVEIPSRSRPLGYRCSRAGMQNLYVPGHYETPTGGCDTISSIETIFGSVVTAAESGSSVLFEGIVAQHSAGRLIELHAKMPVVVIVLSTSRDECVESVRARRASRGDDREFDPKNVIKEYNSVVSSTKRLRRDGMSSAIMELSREDAFQYCVNALSMTTPG